jgi:O-antigen ligase
MYTAQYNNDRFIIKGAIFSGIILVYVVVLFFLKNEQIVYLLIFMSMMNVPIRQLYTSSTNVLIAMAVLVLLVRNSFTENKERLFERIKNNSVTLPLFLVICSYTVSLLVAKKQLGDQFEMYQGIIFASLLLWMIVGTIKEKRQITTINNVMLAVFLMNLVFSFFFILYPDIDAVRAQFLSMHVFYDEAASRIQGLSFRGEAYAEYLMLSAIWLFTMLIRGQVKKGGTLLWLLTAVTIITLIMTRSRGANAVFLLGAGLVLLCSDSVRLWKKTAAITGIALVAGVTLIALKSYSGEPTLLDRFMDFSDTNKNIGYIPKTRYYTWVPSLQMAKNNNFLGVGPSFAPYAPDSNQEEWSNIVHGRSSGETATWPHNITLLVLCTIGFYGLLSYIFLIFRAIRVRRNFPMLDPLMRSYYSAYLACLVVFLIEGQKFDGILRHPTSSLYLIFILIALIFSCENMAPINTQED